MTARRIAPDLGPDGETDRDLMQAGLDEIADELTSGEIIEVNGEFFYAEPVQKFNPNHDPDTGEFTEGSGVPSTSETTTHNYLIDAQSGAYTSWGAAKLLERAKTESGSKAARMRRLARENIDLWHRKNGREPEGRDTAKAACTRCGGSGYHGPENVADGKCFACFGTGNG